MQKQAVMIFGTPGSGKGTQANLLSWTKGFYHFDSGKELRSILNDSARQSEKLIQREKKLNEAGILNTPSWVLGIFKKEAKKIAKSGMSIVYSGSPRTIYEAFGDKKTIGLLPTIEKLYGKEHMHFFFMKIAPEIAAGRNKIRRTCTICNNPVLGEPWTEIINGVKIERCALCMGELKVRKDDDPEKYKVRYNEYMTRTMPIVDELRKNGIKITEINAEPNPPVIFEQIKKDLGI